MRQQKGEVMLYITMTPKGSKGQEFEAESFDEAARQAEAAGYIVVDYVDFGNQNILVIED